MRCYGILYTAAYVLLLVVIFILPFFSFEGYSMVRNSISELGAQKAPNNLIMNITIILMSIAIIQLGLKMLKTNVLQLINLIIFSFSFFLTGVFEMAGPFYKVDENINEMTFKILNDNE